ncbi:hypothetical protein CRG98_029937 [Punica granatum]|uniref:Uncharacterized protein n=1 Tax=Punica granatum TaxID=22663 RepID=A0A2I0J0E3_PUNGR|nr:hypothetical protein CRG98_029937 [Punica granatum]
MEDSLSYLTGCILTLRLFSNGKSFSLKKQERYDHIHMGTDMSLSCSSKCGMLALQGEEAHEPKLEPKESLQSSNGPTLQRHSPALLPSRQPRPVTKQVQAEPLTCKILIVGLNLSYRHNHMFVNGGMMT